MTHSPQASPKKAPKVDSKQMMDFPNAMRAAIEGKCVTRLEWDNPEIIVRLDNHLVIKLADETIHDLIVSDGDMIGEDWIIV